MVCSRCGVGEISEQTRECNVCGFSPGGGVLTEASLLAELDPETRHAVERHCHPERLLRRTRRSTLCLAEELGTERLVALKILHVGGSEAERVAVRFRHEMTRATALDHLHLVRIRHFGASVSTCWYTMDYVASQSVADLLRERATLDLTTTLRIVQQVTGALAYLHRDELTHGNVKPTNILIDAAGWVRLSDYGLARALGGPPPLNRSGPEGAAPYLAPESFVSAEPLGLSADQYALGVVVHECLTGTTRISRKSLEDRAGSVGRAADRPELAPEVAGALRRALAVQPSERFPDILELAAALAEAWTPEGATTDAPRRSSEGHLLFVDAPTPPAPPERRRLSKVLVAMAVVSLAVIGGVATLLYWPQAAAPPASIPAAAADSLAVADTGGGPSPLSAVSSAPAVDRSHEAVAPTRISPTPRPVVGAPPPAPRARRALPAHLFVNSTPWSDLSVDGQPVGHTPKADLLLAPGPHRLRFTRDGFEPYETVIQVSPGATIRLTDITLKEAAP